RRWPLERELAPAIARGGAAQERERSRLRARTRRVVGRSAPGGERAPGHVQRRSSSNDRAGAAECRRRVGRLPMNAKPEQKSRAALLAYIHELEGQLRDDVRLRAVVHELQVHQEELEMQHRQLIEAQQELETARDRYADLFDFAPLGYLMLDFSGTI